MLDSLTLKLAAARFLAERKAQQATKDEQAALAAFIADLRAWMYPKQRAYYTSPAKRRATRKTRRMGATAGGVREFIARAMETPNWRGVYVAATLDEARARAWESDTRSGFADVLRQFGKRVPGPGVERLEVCGMVIELRDADLEINFPNGSQIELLSFSDEASHAKLRGRQKHAIWIDEAQDLRSLDSFYKGVIVGCITDFKGECWLSGTPGKDCNGMFYDVTADEDERLAGWEVHDMAVTDNPFFGRVCWDRGRWFVIDNVGVQHGPYADESAAELAAVEVRWENTAGEAKRENNWDDEDPDFIREWRGRWVKGDARYVYPVHVVPEHRLTFAPMRYADNPFVGTHERFEGHPLWYDHDASILDLPRRPIGGEYQWLFGTGADFGYFPDPFALTLWAWNYELPDLFEMFSWKHTKVLPDDQRAYLELMWNTVSNMLSFVGDGGNGKSAEFIEWEQRFGLAMDPANKAGKQAQEELLAGDIRAWRVRYRKGSPLLHEHRHLRYLPTKPAKTRVVDKHRKLPDGTVPGDHLSDAFRYLHGDLNHHQFRAPKQDNRDPGQKQADAYLEQLLESTAKQKRLEDEYGYSEEW